MPTDLNNMADYRVEWFWLAYEIVLFFSVSRRYNINGYLKTCNLHWKNSTQRQERRQE